MFKCPIPLWVETKHSYFRFCNNFNTVTTNVIYDSIFKHVFTEDLSLDVGLHRLDLVDYVFYILICMNYNGLDKT